MTWKPPSLSVITRAIKLSISEWPGSCHLVACSILKALKNKLPDGTRSVYGVWNGPISPDCKTFRGRRFTHHGWLEFGEESDPLDYVSCLCGHSIEEHERSGFFKSCRSCDCPDYEADSGTGTKLTVIDPTRWVFEAVKPYIYVGPRDHYDPGGNDLRAMTHSRVPPPFDDSDPKPRGWNPPARVRHEVALLLALPGPDLTPSVEMVRWLANLSPQRLGPMVKQIYRELAKSGNKALIPLDNWNAVMAGNS